MRDSTGDWCDNFATEDYDRLDKKRTEAVEGHYQGWGLVGEMQMLLKDLRDKSVYATNRIQEILEHLEKQDD